MYILLPCPTIKDNFTFPNNNPQLNTLAMEVNAGRSCLKAYSDI